LPSILNWIDPRGARRWQTKPQRPVATTALARPVLRSWMSKSLSTVQQFLSQDKKRAFQFMNWKALFRFYSRGFVPQQDES